MKLTRRAFAAGSLAALPAAQAFAQTPDASPTGEWSFTDLEGTAVILPQTPTRIAANIVTAAALWDLGIKCVAVFDYAVSAYPDGDHIAWGNIDPKEVINIADVDGNILAEELIVADVDIVFTQSFALGDPTQTLGVPAEVADTLGQIAPILVVSDFSATDVQVEQLVTLATALGANFDAPEVAALRDAYEAKVEELRAVISDQADIRTLFLAAYPDELYAFGPGGVPDLMFLGSLGMTFANADSAAANDFLEALSPEQAILYPADVLFMDVYGSLQTAEDLAGEPAYAAVPAVQANQVGLWERDFPASYAGVTHFMDTILVTLRDAQPLT